MNKLVSVDTGISGISGTVKDEKTNRILHTAVRLFPIRGNISHNSKTPKTPEADYIKGHGLSPNEIKRNKKSIRKLSTKHRTGIEFTQCWQ